MGTTKKISSQTMPGASSRYGVVRRRRPNGVAVVTAGLRSRSSPLGSDRGPHRWAPIAVITAGLQSRSSPLGSNHERVARLPFQPHVVAQCRHPSAAVVLLRDAELLP